MKTSSLKVQARGNMVTLEIVSLIQPGVQMHIHMEPDDALDTAAFITKVAAIASAYQKEEKETPDDLED